MPDSRETETTVPREKWGWLAHAVTGMYVHLIYAIVVSTILWVAWNLHIYELFDMPQISYRQAWFLVLYSKVAYDLLNIKVYDE